MVAILGMKVALLPAFVDGAKCYGPFDREDFKFPFPIPIFPDVVNIAICLSFTTMAPITAT